MIWPESTDVSDTAPNYLLWIAFVHSALLILYHSNEVNVNEAAWGQVESGEGLPAEQYSMLSQRYQPRSPYLPLFF